MHYTDNLLLLQCNCRTKDHLLFIEFDKESWPYIYITPRLNHYLGFWKRLILGLKYIFGWKTNRWDAHWDSFILDGKTNRQFLDKANEYLNSVPNLPEKCPIEEIYDV